LPLAQAQRGVARPLIERVLYLGRDNATARMHFANHVDQIVGDRVLQQVAHRSGLERTIDVLVAVIHRQRDDARGAIELPDAARRFGTADDGKLQIHQRDVGAARQELRNGVLAVAGFGHHLHVGLHSDDARDAFADQAMIVDAQHADGWVG
jgi:hypothetical protein